MDTDLSLYGLVGRVCSSPHVFAFIYEPFGRKFRFTLPADLANLAGLMDPDLEKALKAPSCRTELAKAADFAERRLRRSSWRGQWHRSSSADTEAIGDGNSGVDFVQTAIERLARGSRTYDAKGTLSSNLNSVVQSLIDAHKKSSDRNPLNEPAEVAGEFQDPIGDAVSNTLTPDAALIVKEGKEALFASLSDKPELHKVAEAVFAGYSCPDIAELYDWPITKVYELNRALSKHIDKTFYTKPSTFKA